MGIPRPGDSAQVGNAPEDNVPVDNLPDSSDYPTAEASGAAADNVPVGELLPVDNGFRWAGADSWGSYPAEIPYWKWVPRGGCAARADRDPSVEYNGAGSVTSFSGGEREPTELPELCRSLVLHL